MSNLAQDVSELKRDPGRLPSQTVPNLRGNVSMMEVVDVDAALMESAYWVNKMLEPVDTEARSSKEKPAVESTNPEPLGPIRPGALITPRPGPVLTAENFETTVPSCAMQVIAFGGHVINKDEPEWRLVARPTQNGLMMRHPLATSHETPPGKSKDPGAFTVTCGIGETQIPHCLIDLELGDKSCIRPIGLLENLTLRVGDLVVPAEFYVLQMGDARNDDPPALFLGRPFLFTTKTKIDMGTGLLSLAFGGKISDFYIYGNDDRPCARKPSDIVHTSGLSALVPDLPEETVHTNGPVAMSKVSSPTREYVKANPPDRWRADPSTSLHCNFGQIEGVAKEKFDLTRTWDPNL
ncbi:unnamed protein product [Rhodiola kirilowii]